MLEEDMNLVEAVVQSVATHCAFRREQMFGNADSTHEAACSTLIAVDGKLVTAADEFARISAGVFPNQVYEVWELDLAMTVYEQCSRMAVQDAEVLMLVSGFTEASIEPLHCVASNALRSAKAALYG